MLKKAGIVILGATAGMLSLAPLASAGEAPQTVGEHGHSQHEGGHGREHGGPRGGCNDTAISSGDRLVSLDNVASNLDLSHVNVLAQDNSFDGGCGGRGGDDTAISSGNRLISADNLLANADVSHLNVLAQDNSFTR